MKLHQTETFVLVLSVAILAACQRASSDESASKGLEKFVSSAPIGGDPDYWIEMKNLSGEWERTGLVFGYIGDKVECENAIAGLKKVNFAREYRCSQANVRK